MADVIFNGTDNRKPLSFAEVSLTFTDCASELNVDWHDVRVTRRVYRDGNSEYLLNKTPCRLRDIQNLFADTGVGRSAYSMMEQGKIDMILSSRPEDRRAIFEEAAGITKYKTQKREALRKLEATEANLLRIGDVIKEVKRQIGSLQRQAGKARRYQALHADLRVLETHHSKKQLAALESELAHCRADIEEIAGSEQGGRAKIDRRETDRKTARASLSKYEARIDKLEDELAGLTARRELTQEQIRQSATEIKDATKAREEVVANIAAARNTTENDQKKLEQLLAQSQTAETNLRKQQELLANIESEVAALERTLAEKK